MNSTNRIIFLYPTYDEKTSNISSVLVLIETDDFMEDLYNENTSLKFGTLYMLDQFGNIQGSNHPSIDDYYEYDKEKKSYILNPGDDPNDPYEGMSFAEYRMLNTNPDILSLPAVQKQIKMTKENEGFSSEIISFENRKFLSIIAIAPASKMQIIYFHPINQLFAPIQKTIYVIVLISLITILIVVFMSISFSKNFTLPIVELKMRLKKICRGDYEERLNPEKFFGEFINLSVSFNNMVDTMSNYRNNMEQLVQERTEELNKTIAQLTETHEQNKRELAMAQKIQSSLIPKVFPETKLLQFSSKYMPMEALGGDLYDVYQISDKVFAVMILDVCGHGVPAALITTMAKISFNTNTKKSKNPSDVIFNVNNELFDSINGNGDYFTAFYGVIDMEKGMLYYSNAGHNTIFLAHADGTLDKLENNGPVVGVVKDLDFPSVSHMLKNGDRLVLYTDGVIEARDEQAALYGEERLMNIITQNITSDVKDFTEHVFSDLQSFCGNSPRCDDIALFAIDMVGIE
jgi:serine phosphatase RsbU (regulator of sigma subunit)